MLQRELLHLMPGLVAAFAACSGRSPPRLDGAALAPVSDANAESLVLHDNRLLWFDGNTLKSLSLDGGDAQTLVSVPGARRYERCAAAAGRIHCFRIDGPGELSLVSVSLQPPYKTLVRPVGLQEGHAMSADDRFIYWQGIHRQEVAPERLVLFRTGVDSESTEIIWPDVPARVSALRDGGAVVYVAAKGIYRVHKDTGEAEEVFKEPTGVWDFAIDTTSLYWVQGGLGVASGQVLRRSLGGGEAVMIADKIESPDAMLLDADHVYWIGGPSGKVPVMWSAPKVGGPVRGIASIPGFAFFVVAHDSLYWIDPGPGSKPAALRRTSLATAH